MFGSFLPDRLDSTTNFTQAGEPTLSWNQQRSKPPQGLYSCLKQTCIPRAVCRTSNAYDMGGRRQWAKTESSQITVVGRFAYPIWIIAKRRCSIASDHQHRAASTTTVRFSGRAHQVRPSPLAFAMHSQIGKIGHLFQILCVCEQFLDMHEYKTCLNE